MLTMTEPKMGVILSFNSIKKHRFIGWHSADLHNELIVEFDLLMTKAEAVSFFADFIFPDAIIEKSEYEGYSSEITISSNWCDAEIICDNNDILTEVYRDLYSMISKAKTPQVLS